MRDERVGAVVVAEENRPLGVVTDRDLVVRVMANGGDPDKLLLRDVMSTDPIFLSGPRTLDQLIVAMRDNTIRRVPVVSEEGRLQGLVSMDDLLVLLADQLSALCDVIRREIRPPR
jgi:CBS domain-containing protein